MSDYKIKVILFFLFFISIIFNFSAKKSGLYFEDSFFRQSAEWVGKYPPDFRIQLINGDDFHLAENIGKKIIILNFFAIWCEPCKREIPELNSYYKKHQQENFILIGIEQGEESKKVLKFMQENKIEFPVGIDEEGDIKELYEISSYPIAIFIGFDGKIKLYHQGAITNAEIAFDNLYAEELKNYNPKKGIKKEEYYQKLKEQGKGKILATESSLMSERALKISRKMICPCGCDDPVINCGCDTAKKIIAELKRMEFTNEITDEEIIKKLNKKYCIK